MSSVVQIQFMGSLKRGRPSPAFFVKHVSSCRFFSSAVAESSVVSTRQDDGDDNRRHRPIYVAATRQHVGKTSVSVALMSGLQKRFNKVGFMKPVGQICLEVEEADGTTLQVDKDAALIKQHFHLDHLTFQQTSPMVIPPGYTRDYIDGLITSDQQRQQIQRNFDIVNDLSDIILCEGTGHVAVGSIVDANNADIAKQLGAKMVLVVNGGLGRSMDELALNVDLCHSTGTDIAGVIINKVKTDKFEQTAYYMNKALQQKYGDEIPVLGCVPDRPFLGCPALADLERLLDAQMVSGHMHRLRHYHLQDVELVSTALDCFLTQMRKNRGKRGGDRTLFVCHASRNDILLGYLMESVQRQRHLERTGHLQDNSWQTAMVVTGCDEYPLSHQVLEILKSTPVEYAPPVLMSASSTDSVLRNIYNYTPKLNSNDSNRVQGAVDHYEPHIDFDLLLDRVAVEEEEEKSASC